MAVFFRGVPFEAIQYYGTFFVSQRHAQAVFSAGPNELIHLPYKARFDLPDVFSLAAMLLGGVAAAIGVFRLLSLFSSAPYLTGGGF